MFLFSFKYWLKLQAKPNKISKNAKSVIFEMNRFCTSTTKCLHSFRKIKMTENLSLGLKNKLKTVTHSQLEAIDKS